MLVLLYLALSILAQFSLVLLHIVSPYWSPAISIAEFIGMFQLDFFNRYVSYFLLGWYFTHIGIEQRKHRIIFYCIATVSILATFAYVNFVNGYANIYKPGNGLIMLYSSGVFLALSNIRTNETINHIASFFSKYSFGIYVVHVFVLEQIIGRLPLGTIISPISIILKFAVTLTLSIIITYVLSKLPVLHKIVRM